MKQIRFLSLTILVCLSCQSNGQMNEAKFTKNYLKALEQKYPDVKYKITGDLKIEAEKNGETMRHFLDNAYNTYKQEPSELDNILEMYSNSAGDLYTSSDQLDTTRIVPIIKDKLYLEEVLRLTEGKEINLVYEKLNEELVVVYAEDKQNSMAYFDNKKLEKSAFVGNLSSLAKTNLEGILPEIEKFGEKPFFMLTAGGDYEASLILLDFIWTKENFPVDGDIVISIPSRDLLMITGTENPDGLEKMKKLAYETINSGNYTLTSDFFVRANNSWKKFDY